MRASEDLTPGGPADAVLLSVLDGSLAGHRVGIGHSLVVGRGEDADLVIDDSEISRRHAVFRRNRDAIEVEDLGSLNGTWVNGARIATCRRLSSDDVVKLGTTRLKVVEISRSTVHVPTATEPTDLPLPPLPDPSIPSPDLFGGTQDDELRPVTALFADIVGSTAIGERLLPEEVKTLVGDCVSRMSRIVEQYGGVIDAYMGDGIAAFFGFPTAHEDDAERAARAALRITGSVGDYAQEIRATWSLPDFNIRVGVNSGQVAVGLVGADDRRRIALGDTMNVAARLQSAAEPGTILTGGRTAEELRDRFLLEPLGPITVKGRDAPVDAWRLVRAETAPRLAGSRPFVGRRYETERLGAVMDALLAGRGQVILLEGMPGIGKTRLLEWFGSRASGKATWLEGRCASYASEVSFSPFAEILRRWTGVGEAEGGPAVRSKLEAMLRPLFGANLPDVLPYLASLLSVRSDPDMDSRVQDLSPEELAEEIRRAYCTWAQTLSESGPLIIAVEDFQWADQPTRDLAESLLEVVDRAPLVLAATFRIEPEMEGWRFRGRALIDYAHRTVELRLAPLTEEESAQLLTELAPMGLDEHARRELIARAEGNPLYLEQLLRLFLESGKRELRRTWAMTVVRHELPSALESLLVARIDALPSEARRLVQIAAVLGRSFSLPVLAAVIDPEQLESTIALLLRAEIIRELRPLPEREYEFSHGLIREAALSTLPRARRREMYRMVAAALERMFASSLDDHLEQLAFYNARAGDLARALWYLEQAAVYATAVHAFTQAADLWKRAASLAEKTGDVDAQRRITRKLWELSERQA
jgi:class 3 adenylate cyclase